MRILIILAAIFAGPAQADPGHLLGVGGHDHLIALGAIGAAIAAGIWGAIKGKREEEDVADADQEPAET